LNPRFSMHMVTSSMVMAPVPASSPLSFVIFSKAREMSAGLEKYFVKSRSISFRKALHVITPLLLGSMCDTSFSNSSCVGACPSARNTWCAAQGQATHPCRWWRGCGAWVCRVKCVHVTAQQASATCDMVHPPLTFHSFFVFNNSGFFEFANMPNACTEERNQ